MEVFLSLGGECIMADENTNSDMSCISDLEADDNDAIKSVFRDLEETIWSSADLNENPELDILTANDDDEDRHPAYLVFRYLNENLEQDFLDANDYKDINNSYHWVLVDGSSDRSSSHQYQGRYNSFEVETVVRSMSNQRPAMRFISIRQQTDTYTIYHRAVSRLNQVQAPRGEHSERPVRQLKRSAIRNLNMTGDPNKET
ncbi:hypothetical protein MUK42_04829 [Musa troglodytarum]|uniref:Uncharacterized protein n=1 Tax=Musa troglodytarum TaxID=320322 RepID=A0A9E7GAR5_9LILI|nr:hypothetical protein MUK42_04829 [Musa troglodytarum]